MLTKKVEKILWTVKLAIFHRTDPCCCAHFSLGASRSRAASCSLGRHFCGVQRFASPLAGELLARSHGAAAAPRSANKFVSATER